MRKQLFAIMLAGLIISGMTACGNSNETDSKTSSTASSSGETAENTEAEQTQTSPQETTTQAAEHTQTPESASQPGELEIHTLDLTDGNYGSYYFINRDWDSLEDKSDVDGFFFTEEHPATLEMLNERYTPFYVSEDDNAKFATVEDFAKGKTIEAGEDISAALGKNGEVVEWVAMSVHIVNYSDSPLSAEECLNNGWWYLTDFWGEHQHEVLGYSDLGEVYDALSPEKPFYSNNWPSVPYLDFINDRFGKPDFFIGDTSFNIHVHRDMAGIETIARGECENNELKITAVFEYDDYTITSYLRDILGEKGESFVEPLVLSYYTKEAWEQEKAHFNNDTKNQLFVLKK